MSPAIVRLCPEAGDTVFEPVSNSGLLMTSPLVANPLALVVVIRPFVSASVDPLSVNTAACPDEPLFVNESVPMFTVPTSFVFVVRDVPLNSKL